jgi:hypothetical protein
MGHADFPIEQLADFSSFSNATGLMLSARLSILRELSAYSGRQGKR